MATLGVNLFADVKRAHLPKGLLLMRLALSNSSFSLHICLPYFPWSVGDDFHSKYGAFIVFILDEDTVLYPGKPGDEVATTLSEQLEHAFGWRC